MVRFLFCGETALKIEVGDEISKEINFKVIALSDFIKSKSIRGIVEIVTTYTAVTVFFEPLVFEIDNFINLLESSLDNINYKKDLTKDAIEIPVIYGGKYGPDLERVAKYNNISEDEVIKIHSKTEYLVYMIGFTPAFPYLGGMNKSISTPRLEVPRKKIWKGSVGIAGEQTGIYPLESPGGWNIIGRTPIELFKVNSYNPTLIKPGDSVKFIPISEKYYFELLNEEVQRIS